MCVTDKGINEEQRKERVDAIWRDGITAFARDLVFEGDGSEETIAKIVDALTAEE